MTQHYDWQLTSTDCRLYIKFWGLCKERCVYQFTSDTFRAYGLDEGMKDPSHQIGALFARWAYHNLIEQIGETPSRIGSNHGRRIGIYRFRGMTN